MVYVMSESDHTDWCDHNYTIATLIAFLNYCLTIAFVIYSVRKIGEGYFRAYEKYENPNSIATEVWRFICKDIIVLIFIAFYIWTFVWDCVIFSFTGDETAI